RWRSTPTSIARRFPWWFRRGRRPSQSRSSVRAITAKAFAKINLGLRIKAKRADGFHDVQTILQAIDLADRLTVRARRGPFEIICETPRVPTDRTNLVWRAAQRLWQAAGREGEARGGRMTRDKHLTTAA